MTHPTPFSRSLWPCFAAGLLLWLGLLPSCLLLAGCGESPQLSPSPTPTPPPAASSFRFVAWADSRGGNTTLAALSAMVLPRNPAFTLYIGDTEPEGFTVAGTNSFVAAINGNAGNGLSAKTFFVRGNHDASDTAGWQQYYEPANVAGAVGATHFGALTPDFTYSFDYQNSHFAAIDVLGDADAISSAQISWLDADLAAAESRGLTHAFLYFHAPIFCVESAHCPFTQASGSYAPAALIDVLNRHPIVTASFHGHEHVLAYTHLDATRLPNLTHAFEEFVTGTAGAPKYSCDLPSRTEWCGAVDGFASVDVAGRAVTVSFYQLGNSTAIRTVSFSK